MQPTQVCLNINKISTKDIVFEMRRPKSTKRNLLASFCKPDYFKWPQFAKPLSFQKFTFSVRTLLETLNFTFCCHLTKKFTEKKSFFKRAKNRDERNNSRCKTTPTNFSRKTKNMRWADCEIIIVVLGTFFSGKKQLIEKTIWSKDDSNIAMTKS